MLTLKFQNSRDLSFFQMVTGIMDHYIDDDHLLVSGLLSEAEIELACNGFDAVVIEKEPVHVNKQEFNWVQAG
jgi:hypothetical protein